MHLSQPGVCLLVTFVSPAKTAEPIEMLFGMLARVGQRNHVLDGGPDPHEIGSFKGKLVPWETIVIVS